MKARRTRNQDRILQLLRKLNREVSAQDLYIELRNHEQPMGLATVYRSLEVLKLGGGVQARTLPNGEALYSLVQADKHHLTCLQCGKSVPIDACPVRDLETQLRQSQHFEIYYHTLEFFGLCRFCQLQAEAQSS
jgi:Fur family transcriptional regulator, ferric uptake regulator